MTDRSPQHETELLRRLIEISRELTATFDLDTLLNRIVHAAADLCDAEAASILLYDESRSQLFFQATTNMEAAFMRGLHVPVEGSIAGWIVQNREPLIVTDPKRDPRHYGLIEKAAEFDTRSILGVPMITQDKVVGVVQTLNKRTGTFDQQDQDTLMTLAAQAAVAIENTRLFHQSDLIAEMVHELRTPLGSLNAATHLLLHPDVSTDQHEKMVRIIQAETSRLSDLATSFLNLSRLESGRVQFKLQKFDPLRVVNECADVTGSSLAERNLKMVRQLPDSCPDLVADREKVKQVLLNLLNNAVKYNRKGGSVTITLAAEEDHLLISVGDSGPGIPKESLPKLFEKFYRVPGTENTASGTGLGLAICKKIVEAHRGKIQVRSTPGEGSTFTVRLPLRGHPQ